MTRKPKFSVGQKVRRRDERRQGTILGLVNASDTADVQEQGYRYLVRFGRDDWSVPEWALRAVESASTV